MRRIGRRLDEVAEAAEGIEGMGHAQLLRSIERLERELAILKGGSPERSRGIDG